MFADLVPLLGWDERRLPAGQFIYLSDASVDGTFLIHHFIAMYIKGTMCLFSHLMIS